MTQRKLLQIAGIVVASVWVFCITFAIAYTVRSKSSGQITVNQDTQIITGEIIPSSTAAIIQQSTVSPFFTVASTQALSTTSFSSDFVAQQSTTQLTPVSPEASTTSSAAVVTVPTEKNDIINAYINGINALKNTQNFSMNKNDTLNVTITDVQMSGGNALKNAVMDFANGLVAPPEPESYTFIGGQDAATGATPNSTIAPLNVAAQINPDAVTEATSAPTLDGGYTVSLIVQAETQTMTSPAPNLSTMVEVIDPSTLLPDGATMTELDISYAPSTVKATFDSQNRIVAIEHTLTSKGSGSGKMIISVKMTMEGTYTSNYTISYN